MTDSCWGYDTDDPRHPDYARHEARRARERALESIIRVWVAENDRQREEIALLRLQMLRVATTW